MASVSRARLIKSRGSAAMDPRQDQSYTRIVTGFVIANSLVPGLIVVPVFF